MNENKNLEDGKLEEKMKEKGNKNLKPIMVVMALILIISLLTIAVYKLKTGSDKDNSEISTEATNIEVQYSNTELTGEWKDYKAKITLEGSKINIEGNGAKSEGNNITINSAGTFYITGTADDVSFVIDAGEDDEVQLVLDNAQITSKTTAPINGAKAKKLTITLNENSNNIIIDAENYTTFTNEEELNGAIYTKTDLVINGSGKLTVNANYNNGIVSKDGLKIINCNIEVNSKNHGIKGKDYVAIKNSTLTISSKGDGIKSNNDTDENLGYIKIEGGTITINSEEDGIQAETILNISENANISITTTGEITKSKSGNFGPMGKGMFGNFNNTSSSNTSSSTTSEEDSKSSKGLKAENEITIESGNIKISSTDDAIHSNGKIIINNGEMELSSEDDGIHADTSICINDGNINITKSYEGIESAYIEINGGKITLIASDDGINIGGGSDSSSINGRGGQNSFTNAADSNRKLVINGGNVKVNSAGDGLDSNGSIYINGGNITVIGPTSDGDAPLDYDGECLVTGGDIIIYGSTGMWQNPSSNSTQYVLAFQVSGKSGDEVVLKDNSGNEITSFKTEKTYSGITISNSKLEKGKSYTLYVNGSSVATLEVTGIVSSNISSKGMGRGGNGMQQNNSGMEMKGTGMKQGGNNEQGDLENGNIPLQGMERDRIKQNNSGIKNNKGI